jgi:hypothetical protein
MNVLKERWASETMSAENRSNIPTPPTIKVHFKLMDSPRIWNSSAIWTASSLSSSTE